MAQAQGENSQQAARHSGWLLPFLGMACGVGVANIYFNQPLLLEISHSFHVTAAQAGMVAVATQVGYAVGLLFFVPLGDVLARRRLMVRMFAAVALALGASAIAPSLWVLVAASILVGLLASVTHIIVPIAPDLADEESRGRAIGTVMTGLLLGILLARTFAGAVATWASWRWVFGVAALVNAAFVLLLRRLLPPLQPASPLPYRQAMVSLWTLFREHSMLRIASAQSALVFASFICFWTTLAFLLGTPHYHLGAGIAGIFGIIGAAGAAVAPLAGRLSDRNGSRSVITFALILLAGSWAVLWTGRIYMTSLILGCILLDMAAQFNQISNQTRIFGIDTSARSRINTIYMTIYFLGASLGSYASTLAWSHWQWHGVTILGFVFLGMAALLHLLGRSKEEDSAKAV